MRDTTCTSEIQDIAAWVCMSTYQIGMQDDSEKKEFHNLFGLACLILVFCVPSSYQFGSVKAEQVSRLRANRFERNWIGAGNFILILISYHVVQSRNIKIVYKHIYMKVEHIKYNIILWIIMTYTHIDIERERAFCDQYAGMLKDWQPHWDWNASSRDSHDSTCAPTMAIHPTNSVSPPEV